MHIIVEGPDNSGKTTLVNFIAPRMGFQIVKGEGPPASAEEWVERMKRPSPTYAIFDRHTAVSEPIYGPILRGSNFHESDPELIRSFYLRPVLFVYCRGRALEGHRADHERDTPAHLLMLEARHGEICAAYDDWALDHAHIFYRIGDDKQQVLRMLRTLHTYAMTRPRHLVGA